MSADGNIDIHQSLLLNVKTKSVHVRMHLSMRTL